jgi:alcohol-forming fatty acyl-CoA reductase
MTPASAETLRRSGGGAPADSFRRTGEPEAAQPAPRLGGRLKDLLAGKKIVMTGVTGFIGEQLLWKILSELPQTRPAVLVRRKGSAGARDRVLTLVRKPLFAALREAAGGAEQLLEQRIEVIEGDLPNVPPLPADLDIVVHCAGEVSFDPPIDQAFVTNVVGTRALLERMIEAVTTESRARRSVPHYVHVSTAYTAGRRRGAIPEAPHEHDVDYQVETEAGLAMRARLEAESRTPERLAVLRKQAEREHRQAGYLTTAADTERRRLEWVEAELVKAGAERARSLGWTDVYTFTKALGERLVADVGADIAVSIVRPAIVESSWQHPYPGWIEGFKMAEPLILAYGRGELPEFPASPDSILDIVPCDLVVNAIVAVCATSPEPGQEAYYHVSSGARNPLNINEMYSHIRHYFIAHPLDGDGAGKALPEWDFPGAARVERLLSTSERAHALAERIISQAPRSDLTRQLARNLDRTRRRLDFFRHYHSLYNEYAQSELHFVDDRTLALTRALHPEDQAAFAFDTAVYDWKTYIEDVHCPSITAPVRKMDALRRKRGSRPSTMKDLSRDTAGGKAVAIFDLDGTIMSTNVIEQYLWARLPELDMAAQLGEVAQVARRLPGYLSAERRDRGSFLRAVYRRYRGIDLAELEQRVDTTMASHILSRVSPEALRRIQEHRAAGHTTILITGVVRPFTRPLAHLFDVIVAADLVVDADGRCTGFLATPPLVGESRAAWLKHYASLHGCDLRQSFAYADSHSDLPMLQTVGNPVAVSPDIPLMRAAGRAHWSVVEWKIKPTMPRWKLPT